MDAPLAAVRIIAAMLCALVLALGALVLALGASSARAAFPGGDGRVAFAEAGNIWSVAADGSDKRQLTTDPAFETRPAWSPDGALIVFNRDGQLWTMTAAGTGQTNITQGADDSSPAWSPDGRWILFSSDRLGGGLFAVHPDGSGVQALTGPSPSAQDPVVSPDGSTLAYTDLDGSSNRILRTAPVTITSASVTLGLPVDRSAGTTAGAPDWSPDGTKIAYSEGLYVRVLTLGGSTSGPLGAGNISNSEPAFSPTGTRIAYRMTTSGGVIDLHTMAPDGSGDAGFLTDSGSPGTPDWQPVVAALAVTVADDSVVEGTGEAQRSLRFELSLNRASSVSSAVRVQAVGQTASSADFEPVDRTVTFAPGDRTASILVELVEDRLDEADETLELRLSSADGLVIADGTGSGTIVDDDELPALGLSLAGEVREGDTGTTAVPLTIQLSEPSGRDVAVRIQASPGTATGADFVSLDQPLTIPAGHTTATATLAIRGDLVKESDETLTVALVAPTNATVPADGLVVTIPDDDPISDQGIANGGRLVGGTLTGGTDTVELGGPDHEGTTSFSFDLTGTGTLIVRSGDRTITITVNALGATTIDAGDGRTPVTIRSADGSVGQISVRIRADGATSYILDAPGGKTISVASSTVTVPDKAEIFRKPGVNTYNIKGEGNCTAYIKAPTYTRFTAAPEVACQIGVLTCGPSVRVVATTNDACASGGRSVRAVPAAPAKASVYELGDLSDSIRSGPFNDKVRAGGGDDRVRGGGGSDNLFGESGNDRIHGGNGGDRISGGPGNDTIRAAAQGSDSITCGPGRDVVFADRRDRVANDCEVVRRSKPQRGNG